MALVLLVEDDMAIATSLARAVAREGFVVHHVTRGKDALNALRVNHVDLVILDLTLPDMEGLNLCRAMRAGNARLQIVILTARRDEADVVIGFDAGADDYISKPFRLAELLARIRARLRESLRGGVHAQDVRVDAAAHRAWKGDEELALTPKEFAVLALLVGEAGNIVPRARVMQEVWDECCKGSTRTLDMHVSALRRKLRDNPIDPILITTVRGVGFRFETGEPDQPEP
jgi:DNA-binding response OmpR family regulator